MFEWCRTVAYSLSAHHVADDRRERRYLGDEVACSCSTRDHLVGLRSSPRRHFMKLAGHNNCSHINNKMIMPEKYSTMSLGQGQYVRPPHCERSGVARGRLAILRDGVVAVTGRELDVPSMTGSVKWVMGTIVGQGGKGHLASATHRSISERLMNSTSRFAFIIAKSYSLALDRPRFHRRSEALTEQERATRSTRSTRCLDLVRLGPGRRR